MKMIFLTLLVIWPFEYAAAKMATILSSPKFDYSERTRESKITTLAGGVRLLTITDFVTGCEFSIIIETGTVIAANKSCDDKYIDEEIARNIRTR